MPKVKILIVEDEAVNAMSLQMAVEEMGYEVCPIASSGDASVVIAEERHPDLVLMDINIPGRFNGIEAAKVILERFGIRTIFVSGYPRDEFKEVESAQPLDYVVKPYSLEHLEKVLDDALGKIGKASAA